CCCCYFFFQAEDGIRDGHVTGVQTCALPILRRLFRCRPPIPKTNFSCLQQAREVRFRNWRATPEQSSQHSAFLPSVSPFYPRQRSEERRVGKECRSRTWRYR